MQSNRSTNASINGPVTILSRLHSTTTTQIQNQIDQYENKSNERSLLFDLISDSRVKKVTSLSKENITTIASEAGCSNQYLFIALTMFHSGMSSSCVAGCFGYSDSNISNILQNILTN